MGSAIQVKGDLAICSSLGTTEELTKIKKLSLQKRLSKIEDCYQTYGVRSEEFFKLIKPLIAWTCYQHLHGMPFTEDLVNNAYMDLIIAFEGGYKTHYNKYKYINATYATTERNIGSFIMYEVSKSVGRSLSKLYGQQKKYENREFDVVETANYTNFEKETFLSYYIEENIEFPQFRFFKFNKEFKQHLNMLKQLKPRNNVLYNFMLWQQHKIGA